MLRPYGKHLEKSQIRMRVTYCSMRLDYVLGHNLSSPEDWDEEEQLVKPNVVGLKGTKASAINGDIRKCRDAMEDCFKYFEVNEKIPSTDELLSKFKEKMGDAAPAEVKKKAAVAKEKKPKVPGIFEVMEIFVTESGKRNAWTKASYDKFSSLKNDLIAFKKNLKFDDLDEKGLTDFVCYLRDKKELRTPRSKKVEGKTRDKDDEVGLLNSSIEKKLRFLHWFLNWADANDYPVNKAFRTFKPKLKKTQKKIVFLTTEELRALNALEFPAAKKHLEETRDCFLFMCFSGMRYSDVQALAKSDIKGGHIEFTTRKTADSLVIELNHVTSSILEKYKDVPLRGGKALPVPVNQRMNLYVKDICKMAGIDEPIRIIRYKGNERIDEVHPKWELVGTHTGRRTFVTQSLSLGIPADVVMKWTGHSDYSAMKPYIEVVDEIKAQQMKKLDTIEL